LNSKTKAEIKAPTKGKEISQKNLMKDKEKCKK
jgi:hypothetical protein